MTDIIDRLNAFCADKAANIGSEWNLCEDAAAEITRLRKAQEWLPIESAPKMKSVLLFAVTDIGDDGSIRNWRMGTGFHHEGWEGSNEQNGYSPWCWEGRHVAPWEVQPTHWQPLPSAP